MTRLLLALALALSTFAAPEAKAVDTWECQIDGNVAGIKLGFIFGGQFLQGRGVVDCIEINNPSNYVVVPVNITVVGGGVGFDFTIVNSMRVLSAGIGNVAGPESFFGSFKVGASAGATLLDFGVSADAAIKLTQNNGFGFELGLIGENAIGLGARLHGLAVVIEPARY